MKSDSVSMSKQNMSRLFSEDHMGICWIPISENPWDICHMVGPQVWAQHRCWSSPLHSILSTRRLLDKIRYERPSQPWQETLLQYLHPPLQRWHIPQQLVGWTIRRWAGYPIPSSGVWCSQYNEHSSQGFPYFSIFLYILRCEYTNDF